MNDISTPLYSLLSVLYVHTEAMPSHTPFPLILKRFKHTPFFSPLFNPFLLSRHVTYHVPLPTLRQYSYAPSQSPTPQAQQNPLEQLAARASAAAGAIARYCREHGHPVASLEGVEDGPTTLLPPDAPRELALSQQRLLDAAAEMQVLATDAVDFVGGWAARVCRFLLLSTCLSVTAYA